MISSKPYVGETLPPMPTLKLNKEGKPPLPCYEAPPETNLVDLEWQSLRTLDLSLLDGSKEDQARCVAEFSKSVQEEGFMLIKNYGVEPQDMQRIYDLADWTLNGDGMTDEDRKEYEWDFDHGNWTGYKPPRGWNERGRHLPDTLEFYNWYGRCWEEDKIPPPLRPYQDEILAYAQSLALFPTSLPASSAKELILQHMYFQVARRILVILSRILGLHDDYLWTHVAAQEGVLPFSSYCRFQAVHPVPKEERAITKSLLQGHTDQGVVTLIPGQPITCLQMCDASDGKWRYVPYMKDAIVCNLGDVMEVKSGGIFRATRHRVIQPVSDQADYERLSVISFNHAQPDVLMEPIHDAPLIKERGYKLDSGIYGRLHEAQQAGQAPMTFTQWRTQNHANAQAEQKIVMINGKEHAENIINGVKVYREI